MSSSLLLHRRGRWGGALVAALLLAAPVVGSPAAGADTEVSFVTKPDTVVSELGDTSKPEGKDAGTATITVLNSTSSAACVRVTLSVPPMFGPPKDGEVIRLDRPTLQSAEGSSCLPGDKTSSASSDEEKLFGEATVAPGATADFSLTVPDEYTAGFVVVASTPEGAEARMAVPDRAETSPTTAEWGREWWDRDLVPALELGVELVLLLLVVSLLANWVADEWSRLWRYLPRPAWLRTAGYLVVTAGGLRLMLLRTPRSSMANWMADHLAFWPLAIVAAIMVAAVAIPLLWLKFHRRSGSWFAEDMRHRLAWGSLAVVLPPAAFAVAGSGQGGGSLSWYESAPPALVMILVGGLLVAWQSAYLPRLRITSGAEKDDSAWAPRRERLAAEIMGDGPGDQTRITISGAADGSPLSADALAAAGGAATVLKAVVAMVNAVLPHAGLELRVTTLPDLGGADDKAAKADPRVRLAASLNRGRHEIAAVVIDSSTFHPAADLVDKSAHDSEIDAVSAIAAWARSTVAAEMKETPWSFYGATGWQSMALHRAGAHRDDDGDHDAARALLARAAAADPDNLQARFNLASVSASEVFGETPAQAEAVTLTQDADNVDTHVRRRFPGTPLALRARYLRAAVHLYAGSADHAGRAAAGLLRDLEALGADPFGYLTGGSQSVVDEVRLQAADQAGEATPWRFSEQPHLDHRRGLNEFARSLAPSAAVLWLMTLDAGHPHRQAWLDQLHNRWDLPYRARYNLGCAFVAAGQYETGWADVRQAMAVVHLGYWALRDPSLRPLWRQHVDPSSADGKVYLDLYLERLDDLGRQPRIEKGSALVDAGLDAGLVLKLGLLHRIDSFEKLNGVGPATLTSLTKEQRATLATKKDTLALAAVPAIGAVNANLLATAGITSIRSLLDTPPAQLIERMVAVGVATGKDTAKLTYTTVRGWQLAARDAEPAHHEYVGIVTGDGTVVLVES